MKPILYKLMAGTLLLMTVSAAAAPGWAQQGAAAEPRANSIHRWVHRLQRLDLTSEQQQKLSQILHDNLPALLSLRLSMRDVRRELRELTRQPALDPSRLEELAGRQGELSKQIVMRRGSAMQAVFAMLTEVQRQRLSRHVRPA